VDHRIDPVQQFRGRVFGPPVALTGPGQPAHQRDDRLDAGPDGAGARWIADNIRDATLYVIEGSGHTNLMEEPELSANVVIEFFQSVAAKRAAAV
jgi:pimeloyl-ACP methyl ester carboxylesterase